MRGAVGGDSNRYRRKRSYIENASSETTLIVKKTSSTAAHIPLALQHTATTGDNNLINFYTDGGNFGGYVNYSRAANQVASRHL